MKKIFYALAIAITAFAIQACNSHKTTTNTDSSSTSTTDTTKIAITDTGKTPSVDSADLKFANKAAVGGMAEVALGKLALTKTSNQQIKDFANMMVTDHSHADSALMTIAKMKNITLPTSVDADHQQKMDSLSNLSGKSFDKAYVAAMIDGHKKTLMLMQNESISGKDVDLKSFAVKTTPVVTMHLGAIKKINASMK